MKITLEKKKENVKTFANVEIGEAFCFDEEIYMKIINSEYDKDIEYNAVKLSSGILDEFADCVEVQKVESELKIKLL